MGIDTSSSLVLDNILMNEVLAIVVQELPEISLHFDFTSLRYMLDAFSGAMI